jgi:hypothetical protein
MSASSIGSGGGVLNAGVWSLWGTPDPNPTGARALWDAEGALFENSTYRIGIGIGADGSAAALRRNVTITCSDFGLQVSGLGSVAGFSLAKLSPWLSDCMKALVSMQCLLSITMVGTHRTLLGMGVDERHKLGLEEAQRRRSAPTDDDTRWCCQLRRAADGLVVVVNPRAHPSSGRHELSPDLRSA